jgi:hypothetical protein
MVVTNTQKDYREQKALTPCVQFLCSTCRQLVQQPAAESTRLSLNGSTAEGTTNHLIVILYEWQIENMLDSIKASC